MKKVILFALLIFALSNILNAQVKTIGLGDCPPGYVAIGATYHITKFNFHKPKTGCISGFGFCLKGFWTIDCAPDNPLPRPELSGDEVSLSFRIVNNQLELHLPLALKKDPEFRGQDMSSFSIAGDTIRLKDKVGHEAVLKAGDYAVKETGEDLVILIDFEK